MMQMNFPKSKTLLSGWWKDTFFADVPVVKTASRERTNVNNLLKSLKNEK